LSDTVTLVAGILLTSVGLFALLPYVLRMSWRNRTGYLAVDSGFVSVLAAVEKFAEPPAAAPASEQLPRGSVSAEELEELMAQLFSLRMTVSDVTAEVLEAQESLATEESGGATDVA
jgi:hypothetical protein